MFLSSDEPADIARIIAAFPEFAEYYRDIAGFREKPEELISMFSRILAEMDRDEYFCMMEDLKEDNRKLYEQARGLEDENQNLENRLNSLMEQRDRMAVRYYQETGNAEEIAGLLGMSKEELQAVLGTGEEG